MPAVQHDGLPVFFRLNHVQNADCVEIDPSLKSSKRTAHASHFTV